MVSCSIAERQRELSLCLFDSSSLLKRCRNCPDKAARSHMIAERRRRVKQKENFAALRSLVPIISKADKASILEDTTVVYLKDLQDKTEELRMNLAESERRYELLAKSCEELQERNSASERRFEALLQSYMELQERNKELELIVDNPAESFTDFI